MFGKGGFVLCTRQAKERALDVASRFNLRSEVASSGKASRLGSPKFRGSHVLRCVRLDFEGLSVVI